MIRYECDLCKCELSPHDLRYVVQIKISQAFEPMTEDESQDDRDYLEEIHDILETIEDSAGDEIFQQLRFDLCPECRQKFARHPLGQNAAQAVHFSQN